MKKDFFYSLNCLFYTIMIGGAVYEHLNIVPKWAAAPPVSLSMFQGEYGMKPELFWMIIHPVILLSFAATLISHWRTARKKTLASVLAVYLVILIVTSIYFVPELIDIISTSYSTNVDAALVKRASMWETLSLVRLGVLLVTAVMLFLGLTKSGGTQITSVRTNKKEAAVTA